jgi:hypothetical protein
MTQLAKYGFRYTPFLTVFFSGARERQQECIQMLHSGRMYILTVSGRQEEDAAESC